MAEVIMCKICGNTFTRKDNLARHNKMSARCAEISRILSERQLMIDTLTNELACARAKITSLESNLSSLTFEFTAYKSTHNARVKMIPSQITSLEINTIKNNNPNISNSVTNNSTVNNNTVNNTVNNIVINIIPAPITDFGALTTCIDGYNKSLVKALIQGNVALDDQQASCTPFSNIMGILYCDDTRPHNYRIYIDSDDRNKICVLTTEKWNKATLSKDIYCAFIDETLKAINNEYVSNTSLYEKNAKAEFDANIRCNDYLKRSFAEFLAHVLRKSGPIREYAEQGITICTI